MKPSQWRHNGRDGVSNHQHHDCLLNRLFRRRSKEISKLRVTGLCAGNSQVTGEFPAQIASNEENVSIWWRHHAKRVMWLRPKVRSIACKNATDINDKIMCADFAHWLNVRSQVNSLAPNKFEWNFRYAIFKRILVIDVWGISCEIALIWMSLDLTNDQSILVQVNAWCRQATSHYLSQCWRRSLSSYRVTRLQWVHKK